MIFACANTHTEIQAAAYPMPGTRAGLGLRTGMAQAPTQGCAGISRAEWDPLSGEAVYK